MAAEGKTYRTAGEETHMAFSLFSRKKKTPAAGKKKSHPAQLSAAAKDVPEEAFVRFREGLAEGLSVNHKNLGDGYISRLDDNRVTILFGDKERTFDLRFLFMKGLLKAE